MIRRLDPVSDEHLLREAFAWDKNRAQWYSEMDAVFGPPDADDFIKTAHEPLNMFIGIFDPEFVGVVIVARASEWVFNTHLLAKRGVALETLVSGASQLRTDLFEMGAVEVFCYVAEKNRAVRKLCGELGMQHEGITMYRGSYRGRVIKWLKYSVRREILAMELAA